MSSITESATSPSQNENEVISLITVAMVRAEYDRADSFCIEVQSFRRQAGIPAINELRNSGKHLLDALDDTGAVSDTAHLHSAINHARRASYEAYEAGSLTALEIINKFKIDYSKIVVTTIVPRYIEFLKKAGDAQRALEAGRARGFDRNGDHTARIAAFRDLREICDHLDLCREEANKVISQDLIAEKRDAKNTLLLVAGLILTLVVIVLGIPPLGDWIGKHNWSPGWLKVETESTTPVTKAKP